MIRLYILEDHPIIVDGIKQRFRHQDDIVISGWSNHPDEIIQHVSEEDFDILIMDLWLPKLDPVDNLVNIQARFPDKPIVIFTNERSFYWIKVMMEKGAKAYLLKDIDKKELQYTLEKVAQGKTIFPDMQLKRPPII